VRVHALEALAPDWGGSIEAMRRVADEAQTHVDRNPRLRIFPGYVEAELAMAAWRAEDLRAAAKHYRRALAHGDHFAWNSGLSDVLNQLEDWNALEQVATAWLTTWPDDAIGYMWRGRARLKQGRSAEALADLEAGFERNPSHRYLLSLRAQALETLGRLPEAAAAYELVLEVAPGQPWASERLAEVRGRLEASREGARRMPGLAVIGIEGASAKGEGG
jgi:tetratricopeptide (TPR) repeat protein